MVGPILDISKAALGYGRREVVSIETLTIGSGEIVFLEGGNGSGKSTILKAVIGDATIVRGNVAVAGRGVDGMTTHARVRHGITYQPQTKNIFTCLTVGQNMSMVGVRARPTSASEPPFARLRPLWDRSASLLSGGERQLLALSMSLSRSARLLLLDEPFAGISAETAQQCLASVRDWARKHAAAVAIVDHARTGDGRRIVLRDGALFDN